MNSASSLYSHGTRGNAAAWGLRWLTPERAPGKQSHYVQLGKPINDFIELVYGAEVRGNLREHGWLKGSYHIKKPRPWQKHRSTREELSSATVTALGGSRFMNLASFSLETCKIVYFLSLLSYPLLHKWMFQFWGNHCTQASFMTEIWKDHNIHLTPQPLNSCPSHMQNIPILLKSLIKKLTWSSSTSDASSPESPLNII